MMQLSKRYLTYVVVRAFAAILVILMMIPIVPVSSHTNGGGEGSSGAAKIAQSLNSSGYTFNYLLLKQTVA